MVWRLRWNHSCSLANSTALPVWTAIILSRGVCMFLLRAATFEGGLQEQAKLMNEMGKITDAAVIITNQICGMEEVRYYNRSLEPVRTS